MKTEKKLIALLLCLMIFGSCRKNKNEETPIVKKPGCFKLIELKNNQKISSVKFSSEANTSSFDFGDLKSSKEFSFLLINSGDEPIYNIHLTTNNSAFYTTPSSIGSIAGGGIISNQENTGLIPLINIGITHGVRLNGVGYTQLLPLGVNTSILTVTGKTISNGDTIIISNSFDLSCNAKVMNIKLYQNSQEIDLTSPQGSATPGLGGLGGLRVYYISGGSTISIKNIGNVSISMHYGSAYNSLINSISIAQSDSVSFIPTSTIFVELDGNGTITDNNRIEMGDNGKGYLILME